ncbi:hypothetical protein ACIPJS_18450 [Streptomyces sp. NPDC086783]|uniref:hypothetical protein n=1 Tax=Streptomyces sp. NPDC086783 TaxID=3365758 RepID=UPI003804AC16
MAGCVAGAVLLTGCAAVDLPLAAVLKGADGEPEVLLRPCGDDSYRGPSLEDRADGGRANGGTTGWQAKGQRSGDARFPLFSPPAAWSPRHRGVQRLLPLHTYTLSFGHYVTGDSYNGVVTFAAEDVAALRAGQVWADDRAMSLGEFEELAEDSC